MSKKDEDLTRIEDLGEYIHELEEDAQETEVSEEEPFTSDFNDSFSETPTDPNITIDESFNDDSFETQEDNEEEEEISSFEDNSFDDTSFEDNSFEDTPFEEEGGSLEEEEPLEIVEESEELHDLFKEPEAEAEPEAEFEHESKPEEKTPLQNTYSEEIKPILKEENFDEVKSFIGAEQYTNFTLEGTPPFSIIIKNIHFLEDIDEIITLLLEMKVLGDEDKGRAKESFLRGSYLISRLSEFAAIMLCHKLRRFNVTTLMGLSSEIHPSSADAIGFKAISKYSIYQNKQESIDLGAPPLDAKNLLATTLNTLEGHQVIKYIQIVSDSLIIDMNNIDHSFHFEEEIKRNISDLRLREKLEMETLIEMNKNASNSSLSYDLRDEEETKEKPLIKSTLSDYYDTLITKLKARALNKKANAIVGINFIISPLMQDNDYSKPKYQISATGNAVWVVRQ